MILRAQAAEAWAFPSGVEPDHQIDMTPLKKRHVRKTAEPAIAQKNIPGLQLIPEGSKQRALHHPKRRLGAGQNRPGGQGKEDDETHHGEAAAGFLSVRLGILLLVLWRVRHGHRGTIHDSDPAAEPPPGFHCLFFQRFSDVERDLSQGLLGQTASGFAVSRRIGRSGLATPQKKGEQGRSDHLPAGPIGSQNLGEKKPEGP